MNRKYKTKNLSNKNFPHHPKVHIYEKPKCPTCEKITDLLNTGANKFHNVNPPLVYSNTNPHNNIEQKQKLTSKELKQIHKELVARKLFEMYNLNIEIPKKIVFTKRKLEKDSKTLMNQNY